MIAMAQGLFPVLMGAPGVLVAVLIGVVHPCAVPSPTTYAVGGDAAVLAGYVGASARLDKAIAAFAVTYAEQTIADYKLFLKSCRDGRLAHRPRVKTR